MWVWHPQGVLMVILNLLKQIKLTERTIASRSGQVIENPKILSDVARKYTIADMITGYGVGLFHYFAIMAVMLKVKKQSFKDLVTWVQPLLSI
jgi:hypothetical protein